MPFGCGNRWGLRRSKRRAVPAHRIRERGFKEVVVFAQQAFQDVGQGAAFGVYQIGQAQDVAARQEQNLERPDGPGGHDSRPVVVLHDDAFLLRQFQIEDGEE